MSANFVIFNHLNGIKPGLIVVRIVPFTVYEIAGNF